MKAIEIKRIADTVGLPPAIIDALISVESNGSGFIIIDGKKLPKILFEPHVFTKYTGGKYDKKGNYISGGKFIDSHPHLSKKSFSETKSSGHYNKSQWPLFREALKLNPIAAMMSTSWGLGQVMGFNFKAAGYSSVENFVKDMHVSEERQSLAMVRLIMSSPSMKKALINKDWTTLVKLYNGTGQVEYYSRQLKAAYEKSIKKYIELAKAITDNPAISAISVLIIMALLFTLISLKNSS